MSEGDQDALILTPVPALVALLLNLERQKGSALTEQEVLDARDGAACIAMPRSAHAAVVASRGYVDIDAAHAWEEWLSFRASLDESSDG